MSRAKRDFLADRGTKELRIGVLEHKTHALMEPLSRRGILEICRIDRMPVKQVCPCVREFKAVDKAHDRRLAAAVRTEQGNELPTVHLQRNAVDHRMARIGKRHVAKLDERRGLNAGSTARTHRVIRIVCQNVALPYSHRRFDRPRYSAAHNTASSTTTAA